MYNLSLDDELVQRTRRSFANETDMTAWLQRQVEALLIEYNTTQQTVRRNARAAVASMRRISELNGNSEMTLEDINDEIRQARQAIELVKTGLHLDPTESDEIFVDKDDRVFYEVLFQKMMAML